MFRESRRRLTPRSSPPGPSQDHLATDHPHILPLPMQEECRAMRWSYTLITHRPPWPHPGSGGRFTVGTSGKQRKVVQTLPSHVMGNVSPFPTVNVLGIVSNGDWALVPNCVQMLSQLGPARGCPVLADSQALLLGHSPSCCAALKDLEKRTLD